MKVLSIGTDKQLFRDGSNVLERVSDHASLLEEMHIVVMTESGLGLKEKHVPPNVWIYPTNSKSKWSYPFDAAKLGKKLIKEKKFVRGKSLITTQDPFECGWAGLKVKRRWRLPLEIQMHIDPLFSEGYDSWLDVVRKIIAYRVVRSAESIRVVSSFIKSRLEAKLDLRDKNIYVLPVYIDKDSVEQARIEFDVHAKFSWRYVILSVARLTPQKNLEFAMNVFKKVREELPNTGWIIVGDGKDKARLEKYAKKLGILPHISFAGWQDKMASYYKTSDVFLQTSIFEGYGMALVEAGLSGLAIVTTPVGIALDLEPESDCLIYDSGDINSFAFGILSILQNREKKEFFSTNAKRKFEQLLLDKESYRNELYRNWEKAVSKVSQ